ncbi:hypothetical protein LOC68_03055 [Blastopirellula sp. JC732]|uniref:Uncharacterized protein n=1 Tax=Blastopirellula sediminis TaxID=2894196 RepID=A0A9X1MHT3_9BACT|nr:hypothetical protein [Blastopirellula sediminis]MCC9607844.1 hypothetical protein [Blastopirellula sediminis]MCC9627363.1 hypothetical protein [Blastopirellula sediminis]
MFRQLQRKRLLSVAFVSFLAGCSQPPQPTNSSGPNVAAASATPQLTAFGAFATEAPQDWLIARTNTPQTMAFFVQLGSDGKTPNAMIKVDVGKPVLPTLQATAEAFAGEDGTIIPGAKVGDEEAILVETPSATNARPCVIVACVHNDKLYLIMGSKEGDVDVKLAVEHLVKTWQWTD